MGGSEQGYDLSSIFEKIKRTIYYHYYRRKNRWKFPSNMSHLSGWEMAYGSYEPEVSKVVAEHLEDEATFIDVGANMGYFSRLAADIVGAGDIYAFEAEPKNYYALIQNVQAYANIHPLHFAVSENNSFLNINRSSHSSCHSIVDTDNYLDGSQFSVPTITLDHFWEIYLDKSPINVLKVDVEGAELMVLKGMKELLSEKMVKTMIIEFCPAIMINAGVKPDFFYQTLASNFSISVIDKGYKSILKTAKIENPSDFALLSDQLLDNKKEAININLLCKQK